MRIAVLLISISCFGIVASSAMSAPESVPTIQQCAKLLPKGKAYSFSLVGSIDTTGNEPKLSGELNVSDNTKVQKQQEGAAFAQCVGRLVR